MQTEELQRVIDKQYVTMEEAKEMLGLADETIWYHVRRGRIRALRVTGQQSRLLLASDVRKFIRQRRNGNGTSR